MKIVYLTIELFRMCSKVDVIFIFHNFQPENFPSLTRIHFEARHTMAKSKSFCSNFDYYKNGKILFGNSLLSFLNNEWRNFCWPTVKYDPYLSLSLLSLSLSSSFYLSFSGNSIFFVGAEQTFPSRSVFCSSWWWLVSRQSLSNTFLTSLSLSSSLSLSFSADIFQHP